jgi:hypothetical protein
MEANNKRVEIGRQSINGPDVELNTSAKIVNPETGKVIYDDNGGMQGNNSNGVGNNGVEGQGQGTDVNSKNKGNNAGDGIIDLPTLQKSKIDSESKVSVAQNKIGDLDVQIENEVDGSAKRISLQKERAKLENEIIKEQEATKKINDQIVRQGRINELTQQNKSFDKEYGKKLMNNISEEFVEKIKNIDINEENNDNTDSLQERMKKLKLEFNELIPIETEEEIEINQKFEEVIKILENDSDKKESKEESEPTEPISGE